MRKITQFKIKKNMNWITGVFKPMFENKLQCTGLQRVTFKANLLKDTLEMEGAGIKRGGILFDANLKCLPMKVSENLNYKKILDDNLEKNVKDIKEWLVAYITIDYVSEEISTEVWYISKAEQRNTQKFVNKF